LLPWTKRWNGSGSRATEVATHQVFLTEGARRDLEEIHNYLLRAESRARADRLLDQLVEASEALASFPERGAFPGELEALGIREYRQIVIGPYRVIYRVMGLRVFVYLIVDGRRDMRSLLERRLLGKR